MYEGGSHVDQFVTRFLLKETANQIQSLLSSVESAVEAIEEQTSQIRCAEGPGVSRAAGRVAGRRVPGGWPALGEPLPHSGPPLPHLSSGGNYTYLFTLLLI